MPAISTLPLTIVADRLRRLRAANPLVHILTNEVVQEITANVLLATGASPAMIVAEQEAGAFAAISGAVLVNVGTLYPARLAAMELAVAAANEACVPWTLDPVAVGVLDYRTDAASRCSGKSLLRFAAMHRKFWRWPDSMAAGAGVDSTTASNVALDAAQQLAQATGAMVAVTGNRLYHRRHPYLGNSVGQPLMTLSAPAARCRRWLPLSPHKRRTG